MTWKVVFVWEGDKDFPLVEEGATAKSHICTRLLLKIFRTTVPYPSRYDQNSTTNRLCHFRCVSVTKSSGIKKSITKHKIRLMVLLPIGGSPMLSSSQPRVPWYEATFCAPCVTAESISSRWLKSFGASLGMHSYLSISPHFGENFREPKKDN